MSDKATWAVVPVEPDAGLVLVGMNKLDQVASSGAPIDIAVAEMWKAMVALEGRRRAIAAAAPDNLREVIARIIDPSSWRVMDGYLEEVKRKYVNERGAYDPKAFKPKESLAKADAILSALGGA